MLSYRQIERTVSNMKQRKSYRMSDFSLSQLDMLQEYYGWNHTQLIEKSIDVLMQLMISDKHNISVGSFSLPDGEKKVLFEVK